MENMKDFEKERQEAAKEPERRQTFTVAGEVFHVRPFVPPEMLLYFDEWTAADTKQTITGFDDFVIEMIEPSEAKTWRKVRKEAKPPLNLDDIENIAFWLLGEAAGRPTKLPSRSLPGSGAEAPISAGA
jgi:hypothetical protein